MEATVDTADTCCCCCSKQRAACCGMAFSDLQHRRNSCQPCSQRAQEAAQIERLSAAALCSRSFLSVQTPAACHPLRKLS